MERKEFKDRFIFIIVHYGDPHVTKEAVSSIDIQITERYEILIIDNSNNLDSSHFKHIYRIPTIITSDNRGFAAAANLGLKYAINKGIDNYFIMNNDVVLSKNFLIEFIKTNRSDRNTIIVPRINYFNDKEKIWFNGGYINKLTLIPKHRGLNRKMNKKLVSASEEKTCFVPGCFLFLTKEVIQRLGFLDESFFLYEEDTDYSLRAIKSGIRLLLINNLLVFHDVSKSTKSGGFVQKYNDNIYYYRIRNRIKIITKYASRISFPFAMLMIVIKTTKYILMFGMQFKFRQIIELLKVFRYTKN